MKKTEFKFFPDKKRLRYEQVARSYRMQEPLKATAWAPFTEKLLESTIAFISVTGAHLSDHKPFTNQETKQDYEVREIPLNFDPEDLKFHTLDWNEDEAREDYNVVFPSGRLILLQKEGMIGKLTSNCYSVAGYNSDEELLKKSTKKLIKQLKEEGTHGALIIPTSYITGETACKMANMIEKEKIPTAILTPFYEQTMYYAPPRSAFINFPFGRTLGKANHVTLQTAILRDVLKLFEKAKNPGEIFNLNYIWSFGNIE